MDLKTCFVALNADYSGVLSRLKSEAFVSRLLKKFLADPNYKKLEESLAAKDYEGAFLAAHTLKGVTLTLGLSQLSARAIALTEALRNKNASEYPMLFASLAHEYEFTMSVLIQLD